jgi:phosphate/sulfate permease
MLLGNIFSVIIPRFVINYYDLSFQKSKLRQATVIIDRPAFDLVRASSNLMTASILIAWATSLKLPLSTTYVSFMVAMGTSLADRAWGRETAVYRVAGVLSVIGGWFITAVIAFGLAGLFALILVKGGVTAAIILMILVFAYLIFSEIHFIKKEKKLKADKGHLAVLEPSDLDIFESNKKRIIENLREITRQYIQIMDALAKYDAPKLDKSFKSLKKLEDDGFKLRAQAIRYIKSLQTEDKRSAELLLYSTDLVQDIVNSSVTLCEESLHYVLNLHHQPAKSYIRVMEELRYKMDEFMSRVIKALQQNNYDDIESIRIARDDVREHINQQLEKQLALIQQEKPGTKEAILETNILLQSRDILAVTLRIMKMYRKYVK